MRRSAASRAELLQAGIELIGAPAPQGTAEALSVLCQALEATGLKGYRVGLGDASLFPALMAGLRVAEERAPGLLEALARRDFVELEANARRRGLAGEDAELLLSVPQRRGGPEVLDGRPGPAAEAVSGMRRVHELLEPGVAERVIFDLGLTRSIGYYTGAVFEVYDPALGAPIGGGGRYDDLLGRFGRELPAVGFALGVDRLHIALAGEERGTGRCARLGARRRETGGPGVSATRSHIAVPRGALFKGTVDLLAGLGLETEELRENDRKLLFEEIGVITMRPSDVPTYVEAGAADLGITGKDVLARAGRQAPAAPAHPGGREVYELLDLGYGRCTMVLASKAGPRPGGARRCGAWG